MSKIASAKEEGSDYPGVLLPGQRVDRKEVWVEEVSDREGILKVMNCSSRRIRNESLSIFGKEKKETCPQETDDSASATSENGKREVEKGTQLSPER